MLLPTKRLGAVGDNSNADLGSVGDDLSQAVTTRIAKIKERLIKDFHGTVCHARLSEIKRSADHTIV